MGKKKLLLIIVTIVLNLYIIFISNPANVSYDFSMQIKSDKDLAVQVFMSEDNTYSKAPSGSIVYKRKMEGGKLTFKLPDIPTYLRVDFGTEISNLIVSDLSISYQSQKVSLPVLERESYEDVNMINSLNIENNKMFITTNGNDPYLVWKIDKGNVKGNFLEWIRIENNKMRIVYCLIISAFFLILFIFAERILEIPAELYRNRKLVFELAKNDFKTRFAGSYFGVLWAFVQPVVIIILYWFVFEFGFRSGAVNEYPFVLWLMAGLVPWFFFSEALTSTTNVLLEYRYLVKKVVFKISILPAVRIISNSFVHIFFILFSILIFIIMGYYPTIYSIQIFYYLICSFTLIMGLTYATSAVVLFFRDLGQIINIFMQVFMWATPIMWNTSIVPDRFIWIFKINPLFYVVTGYRDSLLDHVWFYERIGMTIYFWGIVGILFVMGTIIFKRLRPHFADVL